MCHKNVALAFEKLNSYLLDVKEWMSSSMLKLNPDKVYHAQLKKLDPYLPFRIFGNFVHLAVVVTNLLSGLILIYPLLILSAISVRHASFRFVISDGLDNT